MGLPSGIVLIDDDVARLGLDVVAGYIVLEQVRADMLSPVHGVFSVYRPARGVFVFHNGANTAKRVGWIWRVDIDRGAG